jgi:hypothetical protein
MFMNALSSQDPGDKHAMNLVDISQNVHIHHNRISQKLQCRSWAGIPTEELQNPSTLVGYGQVSQPYPLLAETGCASIASTQVDVAVVKVANRNQLPGETLKFSSRHPVTAEVESRLQQWKPASQFVWQS